MRNRVIFFRISVSLLLVILCSTTLYAETWNAEPDFVAATQRGNGQFDTQKQIIRTSSGRGYFFTGNTTVSLYSPGVIEVYETDMNGSWGRVSASEVWSNISSAIGAAVDSNDVVHLIAYDAARRPYYKKFNTAESPKGDRTWEGLELIETGKYSDTRSQCAIALDANGNPHVVYQIVETYKGKEYSTFHYAYRQAGVWRKIALWPKEQKIDFHYDFDIAIGPDNLPYIRLGYKMLRGNANTPSYFESHVCVWSRSFVIERNGDVRLSISSMGKYANYVHDHTQPWNSGWKTLVSEYDFHNQKLTLVDDVPYAVFLEGGNLWIQKGLGPPRMLVSETFGHSWLRLVSRWSFYNHHLPEAVDAVILSLFNNGIYYWNVNVLPQLQAAFTGSPRVALPPFTVRFTDLSAAPAGENIVSWEWDFDEDGITDSVEKDPSALYSEPGQYSVSLTVTDTSGTTDSITLADYIFADQDTDADGIMDSEDNCRLQHNPNQVDLDRDNKGYACDDYEDLLSQAVLSSGVQGETGMESGGTDVTQLLKDGNPDTAVILTKSKGKYKVLSLGANVAAKDLSSLSVGIFLKGSLSSTLSFYAYNRDSATANQASVSTHQLSPGWNTIDLTGKLSLMSGFGFTKIRIVSNVNVEISEASMTGLSSRGFDDRVINVEPLEADFGVTEVGGYAGREFVVRNSGTADLTISRAEVREGPFRISNDECAGKVLGANTSCRIVAGFIPSEEGQWTGTLAVSSNDYDIPEVLMHVSGRTLLASSITGTIIAADTGMPLEGATVTITQKRPYVLLPEDYVQLAECWSSTSSGDPDSIGLIFPDSYPYVADNDEEKIVIGRCGFDNRCAHYFMMRNPGSTSDGFEAIWNGIGGFSGDEVLAQGFIPNKSGKLTKIGLYLGGQSYPVVTTGILQVFLKSKYGGEKDWIMSASEPFPYNMLTHTGIGLVEFMFPEPAMVEAGKTYYIELHSNASFKSCSNLERADINWAYNASFQFPGGKGLKRYGTRWGYGSFCYPSDQEIDMTFAFRTYVDDQPDVMQDSYCCVYPLHGIDSSGAGLYVLNRVRSQWQPIEHNTPEFGYDDVTFQGGKDVDTHEYYDAGGWIKLSARTLASRRAVLATDYFSLSFTHKKSAISNADGLFLLSGLHSGDYSIEVKRNGFIPKTTSGSLITGEKQSVNLTLDPAPPLIMTIRWPADGEIMNTNYCDVYVIFSNDAVVTVNGQTSNMFTSSFRTGLLLEEGANEIVITASDEYGQTVTKTMTVYYHIKGHVTGIVYDFVDEMHNYPLPGALVTIRDSSNGITTTVADSEGRYMVRDIPMGYCNITVLMEGYTFRETLIRVEGGRTLEIDLYMVQMPVISDVRISNVSNDTTVIYWQTSRPAFTYIEYGQTEAYGNMIESDLYGTGHYQVLYNLSPGSLYHFRIAAGNYYGEVNATSGDMTFEAGNPVKFIRDYGNVAVMEISGEYDALNPDGSFYHAPRQALAREFLRNHSDEYDFFVIFTNFDYIMPQVNADAFYLEMKNDIHGIGKEILDDTQYYGSSGKLQGIIEMGNASRHGIALSDSRFDKTLSTILHEMTHRWGASVKFTAPGDQVSSGLIGKDGCHWSYLLDADGSIHNGNDWKDNGDGTFTSTGAEGYLSPLDLYLMGMYGKTEVPSMLLIENPDIDPAQLPDAGAKITGISHTVTIDDIIAAEGERVPASTAVPHEFKLAYIFLTEEGTFTGTEHERIETVRRGFAGRFAQLTHGRGKVSDVLPVIEIEITSPVEGASLAGEDVLVRGTVINSTGNETGIVVNGVPATVYGTQFILNGVYLQEGSNTLTVTATDTEGNIATKTVTVNLLPAEDYLNLTTNIESGIAPVEAALRVNGSFSFNSSTLSMRGPALPEVISANPEEYVLKFTIEGIYELTIRADNPATGQTYQDTVFITILNRNQLDILLKSKWNGMKRAMMEGDGDKTLSFFLSSSQERYQMVFANLSSPFTEIAEGMQSIEMISLNNDFAHYRIKRQEDEGEITYYIYLVPDINGLWKIFQY